MKTPSGRIIAVAGLVAILGLCGCDEKDSKKSDASGDKVAAGATVKGSAPSYADNAGSDKAAALATSSPATSQAVAASTQGQGGPAEKIKERSNQTFDNSKQEKGLGESQAPPVVVPATSEKKAVPYTAAPPKKQLDDETAAPPAPGPKDPEVAACERVLAAHEQASDGCANHPNLSLEWAGIKDGVGNQFGSVSAIASTLILTAVGLILSGGWAALAKVVKLLLIGGSAVMLAKQIWLLYQAVKALIVAPKGSDEYAEGVRQVAKSATVIAIMAGAFKVGGKLAGEPKQGELPFPKEGAIKVGDQPGWGTRLWQGARGWWKPTPQHA